tara:strand:- start:28 stop:339 length:312 start_codon:yes stop_codon:yes gene_type:complete
MTVYFLIRVLRIIFGGIMVVIASISGWDGVRILGAFETKDIALKICKEAGFDVSGDSFHIDIVEKNKISMCTQLIVDGSRRTGRFVKLHIYDEADKQSTNNNS